MQIVCLLFLPAITLNEKLNQLMNDNQSVSFEFFDLAGKKHDGKSAFVVVRNKYTFGFKESEFAEQMQRFVQKVLQLEQREESNIFDFSASNLVDKIFRSYGIAKNAYRLSYDFALECISNILWGINLKVLKAKNRFDINEVLCNIKDNHLNVQDANVKELEKVRARYLARIIESQITKGEVDV